MRIFGGMWWGVVALLIFGLVGCASTPKEIDTSKLIWPPPPDPGRIKFLAKYQGQDDLEKRSDWRAKFFGDVVRSVGLDKPYGVTATNDGKLIYVTDTRAHAIVVFDLDNKDARYFKTDARGSLVTPIEVRVDSAGKVYVTDSTRANVFVYSPDGETLLALGKSEGLERPTGLALDEERQLMYVADTRKHRIVVYSMDDGSFIREFGQRGTDLGEFNYPVSLALNRKGNLYIVDSGNFRVQAVTPEGEFLLTFGQAGDSFGALARPKGIASDSDGNIYVVDAAFNNFQIFNEEGKLLSFVGSLGRALGQFWLPTGIYIDSSNRMYVVDSGNSRLQVFQYLSESEAIIQTDDVVTNDDNNSME